MGLEANPLADGLFHGATLLLAVAGLFMLWGIIRRDDVRDCGARNVVCVVCNTRFNIEADDFPPDTFPFIECPDHEKSMPRSKTLRLCGSATRILIPTTFK